MTTETMLTPASSDVVSLLSEGTTCENNSASTIHMMNVPRCWMKLIVIRSIRSDGS